MRHEVIGELVSHLKRGTPALVGAGVRWVKPEGDKAIPPSAPREIHRGSARVAPYLTEEIVRRIWIVRRVSNGPFGRVELGWIGVPGDRGG